MASKEEIMQRIETGSYLISLRNAKGMTIAAVAKSLGITPAYMGEIEKGLRLPSDLLIRAIAEFYKIDEAELFSKYGKIPLLAREQFENMKGLQSVLSDINKRNLTDEQKHALYDELMQFYKGFLDKIDKND